MGPRLFGRGDGMKAARYIVPMRRLLPLLLALAACSHDPDPPAGLTADDQAQLNDAAEMLDANSVDLNAVTSNEANR